MIITNIELKTVSSRPYTYLRYHYKKPDRGFSDLILDGHIKSPMRLIKLIKEGKARHMNGATFKPE